VDLVVRRLGGFTGTIDLTTTGCPRACGSSRCAWPRGRRAVQAGGLAKDDVRPTMPPCAFGARHRHQQGGEQSVTVTRWVSGMDEGPSAGVNELHLTIQHKPMFA